MKFSNAILPDMENDKIVLRFIFGDEATFYISGKFNRHNVRIWIHENSQEVLEHHHDFPKVYVFCALSL